MASFDGASPRQPNFSVLEIEVMVEEIVQRYGSLVGKLSDRLSFTDKIAQWEKVASAVSAVGAHRRTVDKIKKKWSDLLSSVKRKAAALKREQQRTGGGDNPVEGLTSFEQKMLSVLGDVAVYGIKCADIPLDTADPYMETADTDTPCSFNTTEEVQVVFASVDEPPCPPKKRSYSQVASSIKRVSSNTGEELDTTQLFKQQIVLLEKIEKHQKDRLEIERERLVIEKRKLTLLEIQLGIENSPISALMTGTVASS